MFSSYYFWLILKRSFCARYVVHLQIILYPKDKNIFDIMVRKLLFDLWVNTQIKEFG